MEVAIHHVVLEWIVVVSLVEQRVYAPSVNLEVSMIQDVARQGYWQWGRYLLTSLWNKQLVKGSICYHCPQHAIEQVSLEVNEDVVSVLYEISIIVEVQDELCASDDLVFPPLGQLLRKRNGEVSLVKPHGYRGIRNYAIGVEVYPIRLKLEQGNHVHWVFPLLDISLSIGMYCQIVAVKDWLEDLGIGGLQLEVSDVSPICAYLVSDVVLLDH